MKWTINVDKLMNKADDGLKEEDLFTKEQRLQNRRNRLRILKQVNRKKEKALEDEIKRIEKE